jgi:hypothetical protein
LFWLDPQTKRRQGGGIPSAHFKDKPFLVVYLIVGRRGQRGRRGGRPRRAGCRKEEKRKAGASAFFSFFLYFLVPFSSRPAREPVPGPPAPSTFSKLTLRAETAEVRAVREARAADMVGCFGRWKGGRRKKVCMGGKQNALPLPALPVFFFSLRTRAGPTRRPRPVACPGSHVPASRI